jgi:hypothetical protein
LTGAVQNYKFYIQKLRHQRPIFQRKMGTIINIIRINFLISANHFLAVEKLGNGLNGYSSKLNENIFIVRLIKINFFTPYNYAYLIIEVRLKIGEY